MTYLFWDVVARLHNRQVRYAVVIFCKFWVDISLLYC